MKIQATFKKLRDFIIRITHQIWEERDIASIRQYYHKNVKMHYSNDYQEGVEKVVSATFEMLNTFPNRCLLPEDMVPSIPAKNQLYSSHRILSVMRKQNIGSLYGQTIEAEVIVRTIADCLIQNEQVIEEWLVRDFSGLFTQLGINFKDYAKELAQQKFASKKPLYHLKQCKSFKVNKPKNSPLKKADFYASILESIWSQGKLTEIAKHYDLGVRSEVPNSRTLYGHEMLYQFYFGYLASFSDVRFSIDHLSEEILPEQPNRVAVRWRVCAKHTGQGYFGKASNSPIYILGISQAHLSQDKVIAEWHLIDEVAIFEQIYLNFLNSNITI